VKFSDGLADFCLIALWLFSSTCRMQLVLRLSASATRRTAYEISSQKKKQNQSNDDTEANSCARALSVSFLLGPKNTCLGISWCCCCCCCTQSWLGWAQAGLCNHPCNPELRFARFGYHHLMHPAPGSDQPRPPVQEKVPIERLGSTYEGRLEKGPLVDLLGATGPRSEKSR
jgi:hypothetical protein